MTGLAYTQASAATVSEYVMQKAIRACLLACACLHSAEPTAVCHCNTRVANVLWDPEPFLADLELAHISPWQVMMRTLMVSGCKQRKNLQSLPSLWLLIQVEQDFFLTDWDEGTLDNMDRYTPQSHCDVCQVGVMLLKCRHLSAAGLSFVQKLKSKILNNQCC